MDTPTLSHKLLAFFISAIALLFLSIPAKICAETATFDIREDTFTYRGSPDSNYGTSFAMSVGNTSDHRCGYMKFEDVSLPADATIDSASVKFYVYDHNYNDSSPIKLAPVSWDWVETEPTWNSVHNYSGDESLHSYYTLNVNSGWKTFDITEIATRWNAGTLDNTGIMFCTPIPADDVIFRIRAKESGTDLAYLSVEYGLPEAEPAVATDYEFELVYPADGDTIDDSTPRFRWTAISADSGIAEYVLIVNHISEDGTEAEEVINGTPQASWTEYVSGITLEEGEYRWYMAARDDDGATIFRTESNGFTVGEDAEDIEDEEDDASSEEEGDSETDEDVDEEEESSDETKKEKSPSIWILITAIALFIAALLIVVGFLIYKKRKKDQTKKAQTSPETKGKEDENDKKSTSSKEAHKPRKRR